MQIGTFITGVMVGISIGVLIALMAKELLKNERGRAPWEKEDLDRVHKIPTIAGRWKMPDDIATIEPLKPPYIEITNNSDGYQLIQGAQRTKLRVDGKYYIPASSGAPVVGITFHYDSPTDTLIQEIGEHPFTYTRIEIIY